MFSLILCVLVLQLGPRKKIYIYNVCVEVPNGLGYICWPKCCILIKYFILLNFSLNCSIINMHRFLKLVFDENAK